MEEKKVHLFSNLHKKKEEIEREREMKQKAAPFSRKDKTGKKWRGMAKGVKKKSNLVPSSSSPSKLSVVHRIVDLYLHTYILLEKYLSSMVDVGGVDITTLIYLLREPDLGKMALNYSCMIILKWAFE